MVTEVRLDRLADAPTGSGIAKFAAPVSSAAPVPPGLTIRPFGPYDAGGGSWQFAIGLHFEMPAGLPARDLYAMATGSMRYLARAAGAPRRVVISRGDAAATAQAQETGPLPHWYPQPKLIVYENVDPSEARAAVLAALQRGKEAESALVRIRKKRGNPNFSATPEQLAELWLADEIPGGVPVLGGDRVGACGASAVAGRIEARVKMVDRLDPAPDLFFNPSYHIALWNAMGWIADGNALLGPQSEIGGPAVATGRIVFVKKTGSATAPFTSPATASTTIGPALGAAAAGDTVVILDAGTYAEELLIDKPVSLMSASTKKATDTSPGYPILDGGRLRRPIRIRNAAGGIAQVSRLSILNGVAKYDKQKGAGGGILVEATEKAIISSCVVRDCQAEGGGIFAEGYGGGVGSYHSSPAIIDCLIERNHGAGRGSGIGAWGYGWPAIFGCTVRQNIPPSRLNNPPDLYGLANNIRGDGGGIAITISVNNIENIGQLLETTRATLPDRWRAEDLARSWRNWARIFGCVVEGNQAFDDGGGIFISIGSRVRMTRTTVRNNRAINNGGGIRVTMRSELVVEGGTISGNESNSALESDTRAGGGGIASRNTTLLRLRGVTIEGNHARGFAGGGISFISTDEGDFVGSWPPLSSPPDFDWNNILLDPAIFGFVEANLEVDAATRIRNNTAAVIGSRTPDPGKGGALYALRFNGPRRASRVTPTIAGQPIKVRIEAVGSLATTNSATFPGANRLYLDDMVVNPRLIRADADLPASGGFRYPLP